MDEAEVDRASGSFHPGRSKASELDYAQEAVETAIRVAFGIMARIAVNQPERATTAHRR